MVRGPNASHAGLLARHGLVGALQLLSARVPQQLDLLQDLVGRQVPDANGLRPAVDVVAGDDGVLARSGRDGELDLGVGGGELGEEGLDEAAAGELAQNSKNERDFRAWGN